MAEASSATLELVITQNVASLRSKNTRLEGNTITGKIQQIESGL